MKKIYSFLVAVMALCLISCGGKKDSSDEKVVLNPETTHIKGDLGDYFEVVDKEYTATKEEYGRGYIISVEVKRTDADYAFNPKGVEHYGCYGEGVNGNAGFGIEILDENGNVIKKASATEGGGMYSHDDMKEAIKLRSGETGIVRWSFDFDGEEKPVKFRLTSAYDEVEDSDDSSESDSDTDETSYTDDDNDDYSSADMPDVESTARNMVNKSQKQAHDMVKKSQKQAHDMVKKSQKQAENMMKESQKQAEDMMKESQKQAEEMFNNLSF